MYNLRYHIASLVSVFIALALGLVLGGLIVDEGSPVDNQAIVDSLKADIELVREQSAEAEAHNTLLSSFIDQNLSLLLADQLEGFAVIVMRDDGEVADIAQAVIAQAGGVALPFSFDQSAFDDLGAQSATKLLIAEHEKKANAEEETADQEFSPIDTVVASVVAEWTDPSMKDRPFTDALVSDGVLTAYGVDWAAHRILGIVDATTQDGPITDSLTFAVMKALADADYPAIVASTDQDAALEFALGLDASGLSALNDLGTSMGDYSLIALLKGAGAGRFGTMVDATAPFALMPAELLLAGKPVPPESSAEEAPTAEDTQQP
jgi:hypothetical protein